MTYLLLIGIILFILWVLGFITTYTLGGYIHILLIIAIIVFIIWVIGFVMKRR